MNEIFSRTALMIGNSRLEKLNNARVAVFGIGGVGSYAVEALCRAGIGSIDLVDNDVYCESNLNRQLYATKDTIGKKKTEVAKARILSINSECKVETFNTFILPENSADFNFKKYDYVIDAIDTVSGKMEIIRNCYFSEVPVISVMGAGNKINPSAFKIADINETKVCPLAKVIRKLCKESGVKKLKCVYSQEIPVTPLSYKEKGSKKQTPSSISFCPSVAGLLAASEAVKDIINYYGNGIDKS